MSGSTIGGLIGGAIGLAVGYPQAGFLIGSTIGGYVDPQVIKGPRITDAQGFTTQEGVPRPIVFGTVVVGGNVIQSGPLVPHEHSDRQGKGGGPVVESETLTRTYATRVCEGPVGGISRIWRGGKKIYDARNPTDWPEEATDILASAADAATFASKLTIFLGGESQLPSSVLESLPPEYGGGVGNVPAYRGTCYVVIADDDLTELQGAIPPYRFEVVSAGSTSDAVGLPLIGQFTGSYSLTGYHDSAFVAAEPDGRLRWWDDPANPWANTTDINTGVLTDALVNGSGLTVTNGTGSGVYSRGHVVTGFLAQTTWTLDHNLSTNSALLMSNGTVVADLRPTGGSVASWWTGESNPRGGGRTWFSNGSVYLGTSSFGVGTLNRIYSWPVSDAGGAVVAATSTSDPICATGSDFLMHMDRSGSVWTLAITEKELKAWDATLVGSRTIDVSSISLTSALAFGIDSEYLFLWRTGDLYVYDLATLTLRQTVTIPGGSDLNSRVVITPTSIWLQAGNYVAHVDYAPSCLVSAPAGFYAVPEHPGYITNGTVTYPLCSTTQAQVTGTDVTLDEVVTDLCTRVGLVDAQLDVSQLTDKVRGFVVGRQMPAADALRSLQQGYFFDLPEWDLKLRGIKRGGAVSFALTDDDLVESDEDEDARAQPVEFPRKLNLIAPDPSRDYEPIKQTAERRTDNIKAVGEVTVEVPIVMTRDEAAVVADKMLKVAWAEAEGRWNRVLPEEFSQLTPSDTFTHNDKRWRAVRTELQDGTSKIEAVRDRLSAYSSIATGASGGQRPPPVQQIRGPTIFAAWNSPALRPQDAKPGIYVAARGLLSGWRGADLYITFPGTETESFILRMSNAATMGELLDGCTSSSEPISVMLRGTAPDTVTSGQIAGGANGFTMITDGAGEVCQVQTVTDYDNNAYAFTDVIRAEKGSDAVAHATGDQVVLLDDGIYFIPIDPEFAGETLVLRAVTLGTAAANNPTFSLVFNPGEIIVDGGAIT